MTKDQHLAIAARALRAGKPIPSNTAAILEARGHDLCALAERIANN